MLNTLKILYEIQILSHILMFQKYCTILLFRCLIAGGSDEAGVIDFYQMHSYAWQGRFDDTKPLMVSNDKYGLDKPNVVGEFSQEGGDGRDITMMFEWAYTQGYRKVM